MKLFRDAVILAVVLSSSASAQTSYGFYADRQMGMRAGTETLRSVRRLVDTAEYALLPDRLSDEHTLPSQLVGGLYRVGRTFLIDWPLDLLEITIAHEIFGHGARAREFGLSVDYHFEWPFPYGGGGGSTALGPVVIGQDISLDEYAALTIAGIESSDLSQTAIARRWAFSGSLNAREAERFLSGHLSAFANSLPSGHSDGQAYRNALNIRRAEMGRRPIHPEIFESRLLINLVNPVFLLGSIRSLFSELSEERLPMLRLGDHTRYIGWPGYRLALFGPEWSMEHLLATTDRLFHLGFRVGDGLGPSTLSGFLYVDEVFRRSAYVVGGRIDVWRQPGLELLGRGPKFRDGGLGGAVVAQLQWSPFSGSASATPWSVLAELGYKGAGYVEGEALDKGIILRIGARLGGM